MPKQNSLQKHSVNVEKIPFSGRILEQQKHCF